MELYENYLLTKIKEIKNKFLSFFKPEIIITTNIDVFEELIKTSRYKKSPYQIQKHNNDYVLLEKKSGKYIDLVSRHNTKWEKLDKYYKDCLGTKEMIVAKFNYIVPVIETF